MHRLTHRSGNCVDLLLTDSPGVVAVSVGTLIEISDHKATCAVIKTEQVVPDVSFSCKICFKSQSDWHSIATDLCNVDWPHIYHLPDSVLALNDCIIDMINTRIPSRHLQICLRDKR